MWRSAPETRAGCCVAIMASLLSGCAYLRPPDLDATPLEAGRLPAPDITVQIPQLGPCTDAQDQTFLLDSSKPVTVLVHGCNGSAGRFRSLAQLYAFHGQQAVCFNYDDRASLVQSSAQLAVAVGALAGRMRKRDITVIGHGMGGLVARRAMEGERGACRRRDAAGACVESDHVFSLAEQCQPIIDGCERLANIEVAAGHVAIVGYKGVAPRQLVSILQEQGLLAATAAGREAEFQRLMARLY